MADITLPGSRTSWLDRPVAPVWQRMAAIAIDRERAAYITLVVVGFLLRIWDVGSRVVHHDESLHAYYSWQLFAGHGYAYDPLMHGPLQFEVVPVFYLLFGVSDFSARLLAVFLGTALIALPYLLRRYLSVPGALFAALALTISPVMLYYSRFIRDDIYLAAFTLLLFIAIVEYLRQPRPQWLYIASACMALGVASMEAAYINIFILATFLVFEGVRERIVGDGPVLQALRTTSLDTWLTGVAVFVVITVLLYSTFFSNPLGVWDTQHSLTSPNRTDLLGGITYWKSQQGVARGSEPWYYYLLTLSLYEQIAVLFGLAGAVLCLVKRSLFRTFLVWWAVLTFAMYTWAGEKMPWLTLHLALPMLILAGLFLGWVWTTRDLWPRLVTGAVFIILLAVEIHSSFALNFVDGANPTEMLIYVQSAQDVKNVSNEIMHMPEWPNVTVGLDNSDVGGWPFSWYLRDDTQVTETATFNGPTCGGKYCDVLLMLSPTYDTYGPKLTSKYVVQQYRWNWWFPEDYMTWFPQHWGAFFSGHTNISNLLGTRTDWHNIWNWFVYRKPFGDRGARLLYVLVRRDLVPGAKYFKSPTGATTPPAPSESNARSLPYAVAAQSTGGKTPLYGPRGIASDKSGNLYVADALNHRIAVYDKNGKFVRAWGSGGTAPGQFSSNDSPLGVAVAPNGEVYVADTWNQRIQMFSKTGKFIRQWGSGKIGTGPGLFYGPRSVAISPTGYVFVADTGNRRIQIFTSRGKYVSDFGVSGSGKGQFDEPSSVAFDPQGNVYVADFWNQRIEVFNSLGTYVRSWSVPDWTPQTYDEPYLTIDPASGHVLATDPQQHRVLVFTETGASVGAITAPNLSLPIGVAVGPGSRIAVSDSEANKLIILAPKRATGKTTPASRRAAKQTGPNRSGSKKR